MRAARKIATGRVKTTFDQPVASDALAGYRLRRELIGTEPLMRWAHCPGGSKPKWIATVIRMEMDSPLQGTVDGVTQSDPAIRLNPKVPKDATAPAVHVHKME